MKTLLEISDSFRVLPHLVALSIAYILALPIGWNRERAERSAGLRTFPLVALASCGIVQATEGILNGHRWAPCSPAMTRLTRSVPEGRLAFLTCA